MATKQATARSGLQLSRANQQARGRLRAVQMESGQPCFKLAVVKMESNEPEKIAESTKKRWPILGTFDARMHRRRQMPRPAGSSKR